MNLFPTRKSQDNGFKAKEKVLRKQWGVLANSLLDRVLGRWSQSSTPGKHFKDIEAFVDLLEEEELLLMAGIQTKAKGNVRVARSDAPYWEALSTVYPLFEDKSTVRAVIKENGELWRFTLTGTYSFTGVMVPSSDFATMLEVMGYGRSGVIGGSVTDTEHGLVISYSPNGHMKDPQPAILIKRCPKVASQ